MVLLSRLKKKVTKVLVILIKFPKRLITLQKIISTKASLNITFVKSLTAFRRIAGTRNPASNFL